MFYYNMCTLTITGNLNKKSTRISECLKSYESVFTFFCCYNCNACKHNYCCNCNTCK